MPPPLVIKEKTVKGFFKPPSYDTTILRPRARIRAPIQSTAADISKLPAPLENDPPPPPTSNVVPPAAKVAKRGKEPDMADGQHRNMINGVWHCSNCGCPESIAVGRRKGPLGDKSQCGTCGKYWHRHRRPRPVEYNSDLEYHAGLKRDAEFAKTMAKRKGGAAALRAQSGTVPATPVDTSEPQTPRDNGEGPSHQSPARELSPVSDASSASDPPVKINGINGAHSAPPQPPPPKVVEQTAVVHADPPPPVNLPAPPATVPTSIPPPAFVPPPASSPPQWLSNAMQAMQAKWSNDKFEVILRKVNSAATPEWRIKCLDCPGKLYTPGPGETLLNYEVHLRNRLHRQRVSERTGNSTIAS
ncbi:hypothetical protein B0H19DRAFT_921992 [Mycena capillaripes]|nr:hypothetical protein B0H19DRAFT_921992 [Mycena capillaripes]